MYTLKDVTAITAYFNSPELLRTLVSSFRKFYDIPLIILDNSTRHRCRRVAENITRTNANITYKCNFKNIGHGPAIHRGIKSSRTRFVMAMDTDVIFRKKGIIEDWLELMKEYVYGIGRICKVNRYGHTLDKSSKYGIDYLHPHLMLINKKQYFNYPPAHNHGAPMLEPMKALKKDSQLSNKYRLVHYWGGQYYKHWKKRARKKALKL